MKTILKSVFAGKSLDRAESARAMDLILTGAAAPEQIAAFLGALRARGETTEEIAGIAQAIRARGVPVPVQREDLLDCCGTGGDGSGTFNISTAAAFVLAGGGIGVAKHGNRSVSSACGSCDVLEALGVAVTLPSDAVAESIDSIGFGFLLAPAFHPALQQAGAVRRALGVPTAFNLIGPLVNPARVRRQVVGVYDPKFLLTMAEVLRELGSEEVMVVRADDGLDEISLCADTQVAHLKSGKIERTVIRPEDAGFKRCKKEDLAGGDARTNAGIIESILKGAKSPARDIVALNAAASFWVSGKVASLAEGARMAEQVIESGEAMRVLERLRQFKPQEAAK